MFLQISKSLIAIATLTLMTGAALAEETNLSVELTGLKASDGKLYISVHKEEDFMAQRGLGGIFEVSKTGSQGYSFTVPTGEYAVSIWHDTDNDGQFSINENYIPTDGWAMSGSAEANEQPNFDDVKITIANSKTFISLPMIYPG